MLTFFVWMVFRPYVLIFDSFGTARQEPGRVLTRYLQSEAVGLEKGQHPMSGLKTKKADVSDLFEGIPLAFFFHFVD